MSDPAYDPSTEGAHVDFAADMSYGDYLRLDLVLGAQQPITGHHDETLFIIQHQTMELWMALIIHEVTAARTAIAEDRMRESFKMLTRVARTFEQLNSSWDVLRTLTPSEYTEFRDSLGRSSGFQSWQYRAIEYLLGNKNAAMLKPHDHDPDLVAQLRAHLEAPSLYDEVQRALTRAGFAIDPAHLDRDLAAPYAANPSVLEAWRTIYRDPTAHWTAYELGEKLVDLEDYFRRWRFNHVTTVERIIGAKAGTGGTSGTAYLRRQLDVVLFPELWDVRTSL
ncbi:tryptophan 2,3-dioxygenase [Euzebya sp.]|uniref:tryptophan 2,3-dioxygenase n=1 Tax=Euzebya sp. TaxID=1971409 RepID=UPI003515AA2F